MVPPWRSMEERRSNVDALRKMRVSRAASTVLWLLGKERGTSILELCHEVVRRSFRLAHAPMEHRKGGYHDPMERHIPRILTYPTHPDSTHPYRVVPCNPNRNVSKEAVQWA